MSHYEVWRQDDNGHRFLVEVVASEEEARARVEAHEATGHKQTWWYVARSSP